MLDGVGHRGQALRHRLRLRGQRQVGHLDLCPQRRIRQAEAEIKPVQRREEVDGECLGGPVADDHLLGHEVDQIALNRAVGERRQVGVAPDAHQRVGPRRGLDSAGQPQRVARRHVNSLGGVKLRRFGGCCDAIASGNRGDRGVGVPGRRDVVEHQTAGRPGGRIRDGVGMRRAGRTVHADQRNAAHQRHVGAHPAFIFLTVALANLPPRKGEVLHIKRVGCNFFAKAGSSAKNKKLVYD